MIKEVNFGSVDNSDRLYYSDFNSNSSIDDTSIFLDADDTSYESSNNNIDELYEQLDQVKSEQGIFSKGWNNFKEALNIGTSVEKCDDAIERYKNGEISFEEASMEIEEFSSKQKSSLNLFSNIATSVLAIGAVAAVTVCTGGIGTAAAIAIGAGTGAVTKAGFKLTDRSTNDIEGDALDGKQIAKDALSGAVTGGVAAATMGTAGSASGVKAAAKGCTETGIKTGAMAGSSNYVIDCAFDDDKDFNIKDFTVDTITSAAVGGTVGGIMGTTNGLLRANGILKSGCNLETMVSSSQNASLENVAANSACTTSYKVLNDRIRAIA